MYVSRVNGAVFIPVKTSREMLSDLRSVFLVGDSHRGTVLYSQKAGGIIGSAEHHMPSIYGAHAKDVIKSGFVEGAVLAVFPCFFLDEDRVSLGYNPGYTIREYDTPTGVNGFLVYHMDTLQVVSAAKNLTVATEIVDTHPRYQAVYASYKTLLSGESVVDRALWDLSDTVNLFKFDDMNGFKMQMACATKESAERLLFYRYNMGKRVAVCP